MRWRPTAASTTTPHPRLSRVSDNPRFTAGVAVAPVMVPAWMTTFNPGAYGEERRGLKDSIFNVDLFIARMSSPPAPPDPPRSGHVRACWHCPSGAHDACPGLRGPSSGLRGPSSGLRRTASAGLRGAASGLWRTASTGLRGAAPAAGLRASVYLRPRPPISTSVYHVIFDANLTACLGVSYRACTRDAILKLPDAECMCPERTRFELTHLA